MVQNFEIMMRMMKYLTMVMKLMLTILTNDNDDDDTYEIFVGMILILMKYLIMMMITMMITMMIMTCRESDSVRVLQLLKFRL